MNDDPQAALVKVREALAALRDRHRQRPLYPDELRLANKLATMEQGLMSLVRDGVRVPDTASSQRTDLQLPENFPEVEGRGRGCCGGGQP